MKRDPIASDSRRLVYREKAYPIFGIPLLIFGVFLIGNSILAYFVRWLHDMPLFGEHGIQAHWGGWIIEFVILAVGWRASTSRRLVFDKTQRRVTQSTGLFSWGYSRTYAFDEFSAVVCNSHTTSREHGTSTTYSLALVGPGREAKLFETSQWAAAETSAREIASFLGIEQKQGTSTGTIQLSARVGVWVLRSFLLFWCLLGSSIVVFGLYFLASTCFDVLAGRLEVGQSLIVFGFLLVFVTLGSGIVVFGGMLIRTSLKNLQAEASREQAERAAQKRTASSTSSKSATSQGGERLPGNLSRPEAVGRWGSQLAKWGAAAIPFLVVVYFAWSVFQDNEPPRVEKSERESKRAEIARKWDEAIRAQEAALASPEAEAVRYDVYLHGKLGQEIKGLVDTARNTFVIHSWSDPQNVLWAPMPEGLPITLYAFDADGEPYDVPDDWGGELKNWMFLLPPTEDTATVKWDGGKPRGEGNSFGWGGFRSRSGKIGTWGARSIQSVPYKEAGWSEIIFDQVTVTRLSPTDSPKPDREP